jgi:hypothetical protein
LKLQLIKREQYSRIMMRELQQRLREDIGVPTNIFFGFLISCSNYTYAPYTLIN